MIIIEKSIPPLDLDIISQYLIKLHRIDHIHSYIYSKYPLSYSNKYNINS